MKEKKFAGIILYRRNLGEKDRILDVITAEKGVVTVLAKGAKNPTNKFSGLIEKYQLIEFNTSTGKNWEILKEAHVLRQWIDEPLELETFQLLDGVSEVILYLKRFDQVSNELFENLVRTLENLNNAYVATIWFKLHVLKNQGLLPIMNACNQCGEKLSNSKIGFNTSIGAFFCENCSHSFQNQIIDVEQNTIRLFIALSDANKPVAVKGNINWESSAKMMNIIMKYYLEM